MDRENTIEDYKNSLIYPIFINGIRFTREQFLRKKPRWFWREERAFALQAGKRRIERLFKQHNRGDSSFFDFYQKYFKTRDYINTGNPSDFPRVVNKKHTGDKKPYFNFFLIRRYYV